MRRRTETSTCLFTGCGDQRDLHVLTHSCPTRRCADLGDVAARNLLQRGLRPARPRLGPRRRTRRPDRRIAVHPRGGRAAARDRNMGHAGWSDRMTLVYVAVAVASLAAWVWRELRSEEHTSELQSLMRISYAVFCLKTKTHEIRPLQ